MCAQSHFSGSFGREFRFADVRVLICRRPSFDLQTSEFRFADVPQRKCLKPRCRNCSKSWLEEIKLHLRDIARGGDGRLGPILLLLPHEPLLLLPGDAAAGLAGKVYSSQGEGRELGFPGSPQQLPKERGRELPSSFP